MVGPSTWELEAWKAKIGLLDRLMLVMMGALFLPALTGKEAYPPVVFYVFDFIFAVCGFFWVKSIREAANKKGEK